MAQGVGGSGYAAATSRQRLKAILRNFANWFRPSRCPSHLADGGRGPVSERAALRALAIAEYAEAHARRCYGAGAQADAVAAKAILLHIRKGDLKEGFSLRDAMRNDWSNLTNRDLVSAGLNLFVDLQLAGVEDDATGGR